MRDYDTGDMYEFLWVGCVDRYAPNKAKWTSTTGLVTWVRFAPSHVTCQAKAVIESLKSNAATRRPPVGLRVGRRTVRCKLPAVDRSVRSTWPSSEEDHGARTHARRHRQHEID